MLVSKSFRELISPPEPSCGHDALWMRDELWGSLSEVLKEELLARNLCYVAESVQLAHAYSFAEWLWYMLDSLCNNTAYVRNIVIFYCVCDLLLIPPDQGFWEFLWVKESDVYHFASLGF